VPVGIKLATDLHRVAIKLVGDDKQIVTAPEACLEFCWSLLEQDRYQRKELLLLLLFPSTTPGIAYRLQPTLS
jgi:hypothetical protein